MPKKVSVLRNITRMDYAHTHGWWVRIYRGPKSEQKLHSKMFSDGVWGGSRLALKAAIACRDKLEKRLPKPQRSPRPSAPVGYGYVKRQTLWRRASASPVYLAWIKLGQDRAGSTSYSIEVWGEDGARAMCERYLRSKRRELRAANRLQR